MYIRKFSRVNRLVTVNNDFVELFVTLQRAVIEPMFVILIDTEPLSDLIYGCSFVRPSALL